MHDPSFTSANPFPSGNMGRRAGFFLDPSLVSAETLSFLFYTPPGPNASCWSPWLARECTLHPAFPQDDSSALLPQQLQGKAGQGPL